MTLLYLLPNLALFLVLYRMAGARLHLERPAIFFFLCAWLAYSLANLLASAVHATGTAAFARFYFWSSIAVLALVAWPLGRPATALLLHHTARALLIPVLVFFAALLIHALLRRGDFHAGTLALGVTCFLAVLAGSIFFLASFGAEDPDRILWRGLGGYLLVFGYGLLLARLLGRDATANAWPLFACTAVWLLLAWFIAPTRDQLLTLEKLAWIWPSGHRLIAAFRRAITQ